MPKASPVVLATRYLDKEWKRRLNRVDNPPLDLTRSVCSVVMVAGYKRQTVDELLTGYIKNVLCRDAEPAAEETAEDDVDA